jgi:hypothetical protein
MERGLDFMEDTLTHEREAFDGPMFHLSSMTSSKFQNVSLKG